MNPLLHRYWFEFGHVPYSFLNLGIGVTAFSASDAMELLKLILFADEPFPTIRGCVTDIDVSTLDRGHIIPNMGDPTIRGVWFPNCRLDPKLATESKRRRDQTRDKKVYHTSPEQK